MLREVSQRELEAWGVLGKQNCILQKAIEMIRAKWVTPDGRSSRRILVVGDSCVSRSVDVRFEDTVVRGMIIVGKAMMPIFLQMLYRALGTAPEVCAVCRLPFAVCCVAVCCVLSPLTLSRVNPKGSRVARHVQQHSDLCAGVQG